MTLTETPEMTTDEMTECLEAMIRNDGDVVDALGGVLVCWSGDYGTSRPTVGLTWDYDCETLEATESRLAGKGWRLAHPGIDSDEEDMIHVKDWGTVVETVALDEEKVEL